MQPFCEHLQQPPATANPFRNAEHVKLADLKGHHAIFPQYIDANLTPAEGRRVTRKQAVATPVIEEIAIALEELGFKRVALNVSKSYPRSQGSSKFPIPPRGCVMVVMKEPASPNADQTARTAVVPALKTKHQLLVKVAECIKRKGGERPKLRTAAELLAAHSPNQPKSNKK